MPFLCRKNPTKEGQFETGFNSAVRVERQDRHSAFDEGRLDARPIDCRCYLERGPIPLNQRLLLRL